MQESVIYDEKSDPPSKKLRVHSNSEVHRSESRSKYHKIDLYNVQCRVLYSRCLAFPTGPGGFRELREAYTNHFHYPGTNKGPWSRVMAKNPPREFFTRVRYEQI